MKGISRTFSTLLLAAVMGAFLCIDASAAKVDPQLATRLNTLANADPVGVVIISFNGSGLTAQHLSVLQSVGISDAVTFQKLGMVGAALTAGQVRALSTNPAVRSIWTNNRLQYYMNHSRMLTGVDKLRSDAALTFRNGGMPVSGSGDFSVMVIDSGIDATHSDLQYGVKVIQNTQRVVSTNAGNTGITVGGVPLNGFTPSLSIENLPNTDNVGHGTHCAGIVGGTGMRSGSTFGGVAPGVKIVGSGGGVVILVLDALAGWEYALANQDLYKIRVITNSYGPLESFDYDPDHPLSLATQAAYERNMTVLWAASNDGAEDTVNPYSQGPYAISVAAGTKEGLLADFSSRGVPREKRLNDDNPANDNETPTITAPGTGVAFESSRSRFNFTTDMISVRASTGLTNVLGAATDQAEIAPGMLPFYTGSSGTSMATPFVAGVVALMLDADPTLTPDEIKQILIDTASRMPGYADHEVGAGYVNAYAAVDKVYNRSRRYANIQEVTFNASLAVDNIAPQPFHIDFNPAVSGPTSTNAVPFNVEANVSVVTARATVDAVTELGATNLVGIKLIAPDGTQFAPGFPIGTSNVREVSVNDPMPGTWYVEARGTRGVSTVPATSPTAVAAPGPVDGTVTQTRYIVPNIADIAGHADRTAIEEALRQRLIDTFADGTFRPASNVTRGEFAEILRINTLLRQSLVAAPRFSDVSGELGRIAEAVTAKGSTLRDYDFVPTGMMNSAAATFSPDGTVSRLDAAVAFVKALGYDANARSLANTTVRADGVALTDNAQIPGALRGYVQIAIDKGLFEAFPAEIRQIAPGQFIAVPGPRFEPGTAMTRATMAGKLVKYRQLFTTGG
jgi:serine protease AprX